METNNKPNPGSREAQIKGCKCPVIDNDYGKGIPYPTGTEFIYNLDCEIHGDKK